MLWSCAEAVCASNGHHVAQPSGYRFSCLYNLAGGIMAWGQIAPEDIVYG